MESKETWSLRDLESKEAFNFWSREWPARQRAAVKPPSAAYAAATAALRLGLKVRHGGAAGGRAVSGAGRGAAVVHGHGVRGGAHAHPGPLSRSPSRSHTALSRSLSYCTITLSYCTITLNITLYYHARRPTLTKCVMKDTELSQLKRAKEARFTLSRSTARAHQGPLSRACSMGKRIFSP